MLAIADQFFGASEADLVRARSGTERRVSFYRAWVAKEAVLKADGGGLTIPLNRFEVVFANASIGNLRSSDPECSGAGWTVRLLHLACGWHAAVASSDDRWRIRFRTRVAPPGAAPSAIP